MTLELIEKFGKVAVLFGGTTSEREVSIASGQAVTNALQQAGVDAIGIDVQPGFLSQLPGLGLDRVVVMLHGGSGEDGTLQGALQMQGIPYTGSGVLACALAMDKLRTKQMWLGSGLPTAQFIMLTATTNWQQALDKLGGKAMVKPVSEGSSVGMSIATTPDGLKAAWQQAHQFDHQVMAEQWLAGEEYTVAVVGDQVLPPIKLETDREFYDYQAKYIGNHTRYICPCGLSDSATEQLKQLAGQAFASLGCNGWGRVDVMTDQQGNFNLLEVNTVPGMTDHSLVPMAAKAAGIDFQQLVVRILASSLGER